MYSEAERQEIIWQIDQVPTERAKSAMCRKLGTTMQMYCYWKYPELQKENASLRAMIETLKEALAAAQAKPPRAVIESEIMAGLAAGKTNKEIARSLSIPHTSFKRALQRIYSDRKVTNREELRIRIAVEKSLKTGETGALQGETLES